VAVKTLLFGYASLFFRWLIVGLLCLFAGPKILILLPCWLAGVFVYRFRYVQIGLFVTWSAAIIVPAILVIALAIGLKDRAHEISKSVTYFHNSGSEAFLRSWIVSAIVAIHLGACVSFFLFSRSLKRACLIGLLEA
jgi:hypothetical protein